MLLSTAEINHNFRMNASSSSSLGWEIFMVSKLEEKVFLCRKFWNLINPKKHPKSRCFEGKIKWIYRHGEISLQTMKLTAKRTFKKNFFVWIWNFIAISFSPINWNGMPELPNCWCCCWFRVWVCSCWRVISWRSSTTNFPKSSTNLQQ